MTLRQYKNNEQKKLRVLNRQDNNKLNKTQVWMICNHTNKLATVAKETGTQQGNTNWSQEFG